MEIDDTLAYLLGTWSVARLISDHRSGGTGTFLGTAEVRAPGRGLAHGDDGGNGDDRRGPGAEDGGDEGDGVEDDGAGGGDGAEAAHRWASYQEVGQLSLGGHEGTATRRLRYRRRVDGAVLMEFGDGRPFVACDLRGGRWQAYHSCGEDRYELRYVVRAQDLLEEHWRVRGPAKDYEAWTTLQRQLPSGPPPR